MPNNNKFTLNRRGFMAGTATVAGVSALSASLPMKAALALDSFREGPVVDTAQGKLKGLVDRDVTVFRGIRYGADTGGLGRFLPPKAPPSWAGVVEAFQFGPIAPQFEPGKPRANNKFFPIQPANLPENEDCLRLNIYTPSLDRNAKKPVMVWHHGGGFSSGAGSMPFYHGENLARKGDVVVVTINHRLNVFGFTNLGGLIEREFATSGNVGMLDAVAALKWVHENIAGFGGDPNNVTIFGESGGGSKVSTLLAMPDAKGLFHRAIIESGPGVRMGDPAAATKVTELLLKELGIPSASARKLQQVPQEALLTAYFAVAPNAGFGGFSPIVDGISLPRHPFAPDATPVSEDVPLMIGSNHDEGTIFLGNVFGAANLDGFQIPDAQINMDEAALKRIAGRVPGVKAEKVIKSYKSADPKGTPWDIAVAIQTDMMMGVNTTLIAERKAAQGKAPVYLYRFDRGTTKLGGHLGACHTVEIPFVFNNLTTNDWLVDDTPENQKLADTMTATWSAFAHTGDPNNVDLPGWPIYSAKTRDTMILDLESRVEQDPRGAQRKMLAKAMAGPA